MNANDTKILNEKIEKANENVTIKYIDYIVVEASTPEDRDEQGLENIARVMRENGVSRQLLLKRPRGNKLYFANEFKNAKTGRIGYSKVTGAL